MRRYLGAKCNENIKKGSVHGNFFLNEKQEMKKRRRRSSSTY